MDSLWKKENKFNEKTALGSLIQLEFNFWYLNIISIVILMSSILSIRLWLGINKKLDHESFFFIWEDFSCLFWRIISSIENSILHWLKSWTRNLFNLKAWSVGREIMSSYVLTYQKYTIQIAGKRKIQGCIVTKKFICSCLYSFFFFV